MRTNEEYREWIDSYLKGNLSPSETAQLQEEASKNLGLQNELFLQKTIVKSLQEHRKMELKARLSSMEISANAGSATWKYAAAIGGLLLVGWASYQYRFAPLQDEEEVEVTNIPLSLQEDNETAKSPEQLAFKDELQGAPVLSPRATPTAPEARKETSEGKEQRRTEEGIPALPEINTPEGIAHEPLNKEIVNPEHGLGKTSHVHASMSGVEVIKSKKHKFHYRYFDSKLFLYGDFEAKTYEILELNTSHGQRLFLKFENKYYGLEPNKTEISKLETVKDKETLKELEEVQGK